jgi:hypothetical protein
MNMGQTMITSGMFVLLVMSVISANRMLIEDAEITYQAEAFELSASIAEDLMAEASAKLFDVKDDGTGTQDYWEFGSCGTSSSEAQYVTPLPDKTPFKSVNGYNDFDDYNDYTRIVDADSSISGFKVRVSVYYIDPAYPDIPSYWSSYFKKMEVGVSHPKYIVDKEGKAFDKDGKPVEIVYTTIMSY